MKLISCHDGKLHALESGAARAGPWAAAASDAKVFRTGLAALDALPPGGALARGAVHELLTGPADATPMFLAAWLARRAWVGDDSSAKESRAVVWCDPRHELYPPAVAALGIPLERLLLLHPVSEAEHVWAVAECLRCRGVAAVVAALPPRYRLTRVEARRLQLAAERGGGVGLLLRTMGKSSDEHAAVTRWLVQPARGERNVQRWRIQLIFGHGGQVGQSVILEHHRDPQSVFPRVEAHPLRPSAELADRPAVPPASRAAG
jgi:protein ImuA